MNKAGYSWLFFSILFYTHSSILCSVIGSETVVSIESEAFFPAEANDNMMLGFGWFKNGFSLQDETTTCAFNSVYPVSGSVNLNGGTLTLLQDLIFHNSTVLEGFGNIVGNSFMIDLCTSITALPSDASILKDVHLFFSNDLLVTGTITLQGNCSFSGNGSSLVLGSNGNLIIDSNSQVKFQGMEIKRIHGENIQCKDDSGQILLNDVIWEQDGNFTFASGSLFLQDMVTLMGTATFAYESSQTSTIDTNSTFHLTNGIHLSIGRDPISLNEPLAFTDSTSVMRLANCGYDISSTGITLTKGTIFFDNHVDTHINSSSFATGVTIGTGNIADDFTVYFSPGCSINHYGHMTYNNAQSDRFKSTSHSTHLVRQVGSRVLCNTNFQMPEITVELASNSVPPLQVANGSALSFNDTSIILPAVAFDITGLQQSVSTYILPGNGIINFSKGSLPLALIIENSGNQILGNGNIVGPIILADSSASLLFALNGYMSNSCTLNGGTVILGNDFTLYNNGIIVGPGTVNLVNNILHVNNDISNWASPITWQSNGGFISIDEKLSLASTWTVQGNCTIDGNNNELEFLENGEIVIDHNSELYLKNLRLQSIADVNIRCLDDTGVLILDDVYWTQTDNYSFQKGSIRIINDVDLVGSYTFSYESLQTSTISVKSTLTARDHLNLSIGKQQINGAQEPLELSDSTSLIIIDNAQWTITGDGMRLKKGRAICVDDVLIDIQSTNSAQGLKLGDSTQAGDMTFEFRPGATVRIPRGHVVCDWYASNNVKSQSTTAQLIREASNAFYCNSDILLSNLSLVTEPGAPLVVANGKAFLYENCVFDVPGGRYTLNGKFYNAYTNQLNGNDSLIMGRGILPLYTTVNNTGNVFEGNGTISGPINLSNTASLSWAVNGMLASDLLLNGGQLNLGIDMYLANGAVIHGPGTINLMGYSLKYGSKDFIADTPLNFNATGGAIELKSALSLTSTWTVSGNCTIQGNGNTIDMGSAGQIVIDNGSTLYLYDVSLKNVANTNIRCMDDEGIIILDNVQWSQKDNDFTFKKGALIIKDQVYMSGEHSFIYESQMASTISAHSSWNFDRAMTFDYAPTSSLQNLIEFADTTSQLNLFETALRICPTGLKLTKGTIVVEGTCPFYIESNNALTGLILGDGVSSENDVELIVKPESSMNIVSGYFNYQNIS